MNEPLTHEEIADLADRWYKALDVHAPVEELFTMLLDDGNVMEWPEGPTHGHAEFRDSCYERVIRIFFDEVHLCDWLLLARDPSLEGMIVPEDCLDREYPWPLGAEL